MNAKLVSNCYGKTAVRITRVRRLADRHELVEMNVHISLTGGFERSYTHGDNTTIIATDSMKNTVYLLGKEHPMDSPESFGLHLARHFLKTYSHVQSATVQIEQSAWNRIEVDGQLHPTAFASGGSHLRTAHITADRTRTEIHGGLKDLLVLKTTDSAFAGFVTDQFRSLADSHDRILATKITADWKFTGENADFNAAFEKVQTAMLGTFAGHKSLAVQQTLFDMGAAALAVEPAIVGISITLPNKHRIPFNFKPFGKEFNNDVYITTDEPSGSITGYIERENA